MSDEARCPHCLEDRLVEWEPVTRRWVCLVCAKTWPPPVVVAEARREWEQQHAAPGATQTPA